MYILGIETSCDETAASVVKDGREILSNVVVSQIDIFKAYGGVIPEVAARSHLEAILPVINKALEDANLTWAEIDAIAVTHTPGLLGSLLIGTLAARTLAILHHKPLYTVHHLKSHIYANWLKQVPQENNKEIPPLLEPSKAELDASSGNKGFLPANSQRQPISTTTDNYRRSDDRLAVVDLKTAQRTPPEEVSSSASQDEISRSENPPSPASQGSASGSENPPSPASQDLKTAQRTPSGEVSSLVSRDLKPEQEAPLDEASSLATQETSPSPNNFTWESYFLSVQSASPSLADILLKASHELSGSKLVIVPEKKVYKNILSSKNNSVLLQKFLPNGYTLEIKDQNDAVISTNDAQISKLSAIMGGKIMEVKDEHGGNPF